MGGATAGALTVVGFGVWLAIDAQSFLQAAHYAAAVGMFGVFVVVARLNAASARDDLEGPVVDMLPAQRRRAAYKTISWSMLGTVVVAGVLGLLQLAGSTPVPHWLFWVESILLALFAAFWALQTIEYWRDGVPLDGPLTSLVHERRPPAAEASKPPVDFAFTCAHALWSPDGMAWSTDLRSSITTSIGSTRDLDARLWMHQAGRGC